MSPVGLFTLGALLLLLAVALPDPTTLADAVAFLACLGSGLFLVILGGLAAIVDEG